MIKGSLRAASMALAAAVTQKVSVLNDSDLYYHVDWHTTCRCHHRRSTSSSLPGRLWIETSHIAPKHPLWLVTLQSYSSKPPTILQVVRRRCNATEPCPSNSGFRLFANGIECWAITTGIATPWYGGQRQMYSFENYVCASISKPPQF